MQQTAGACSSGYPVPSWQSGFATTSSGRNVPDVSFLAGNGLYGAVWGLCTDLDTDSSGNPVADCAGTPTTGSNFYLSGVGGTSAAAPTFAGILALIKQKTGSRLGQADYVLYDLAKSHYGTVYHDVTTGNNSVACSGGSPGCAQNAISYYFMTGYNATTGFDEASGLGSVDVSQLAGNWAAAGLAATTASLTLNGSTAALNITHGTSVQVGVGVTGSGGTPAGNVALVDSINPALVPNSGSIASFALASGTATGTTDSLPGGSYNVSAHYGGSQSFAESDSNSIPVTVTAESSTTTLTVRGYYDPETGQSASTPYYGYIYLVDAQPYGNSASASNPDGAAAGTITFKSGSATVGTAQLASDGIAELQTSTIPGGNDSLTAVFPGDASFKASTSSPVAFTVQPALSTLNMSSDKGSYNVGDSATITATFAEYSYPYANHLDSLGAVPTGTITFSAGSTTLGTANITGTAGSATSLVTASASFNIKSITLLMGTIEASYSGDLNYAASGGITNLFVTGARTNMTMTPASNSIKVNQSLQVTVSLPASGALAVPTGTVTFTVYTADLSPVWTSPAVTVASGSAGVTVPANALPLGALTLNAVYSGDDLYYGASASAALQVNSSGTITPTVSLTLPTGTVNGTFSLGVTVSGPSGDPIPTGVLMTSSSQFITYPLVNGSAIISFGFPLPPGPNSLTVTYLGDSNYTAGTATGIVNEIATPTINFTPVNPTVAVNQALTVAVAIAPAANVPTATGTITLSSGTYQSAATTLASGSVSITIPANSLAQGAATLTAAYSGDANYAPGNNTELITVTAPAPPGLTLSGTNVTLAPGATTANTSTVTVSPTGGFTGSVSLSAALTNLPENAVDPPTLSFGTTSPVTISGTSSQTATLTITTTAPSSATVAPPTRPGAHWRSGAIAFASVLLLGIGAIRRRWRSALARIFLLVVLAGGAISCGGSGGSGGGGGNGNLGTTGGSYTITVTATSGTVSGTTTINLNVN